MHPETHGGSGGERGTREKGMGGVASLGAQVECGRLQEDGTGPAPGSLRLPETYSQSLLSKTSL